MNAKEFAKEINGFEYPAYELNSFGAKARENGLVFIHGCSDDLVQMRGIIDNETGAMNGIKIKIGSAGVNVDVIWSPADKPLTSWEVVPDCPYEKFHIMEDGDVFCIGAVIEEKYITSAVFCGWRDVNKVMPPVGQKVILFDNGVVQEETYELDQGDDGVGAGEYFWSRYDLDECPAVESGQFWMPLPDAPST